MNSRLSILIAGWLSILAINPGIAEHPFLICKRSEFPALRARSSEEPWKSMKDDAIAKSDGGIDSQSGTDLQLYIGACALSYILDEPRSAIHAVRVRDAILVELDQVVFDPALRHAGTVSPMAATFMCILGLDVVYDDLTEDEIIACEETIQSKLNLIPQNGHWPAARWGTHRT